VTSRAIRVPYACLCDILRNAAEEVKPKACGRNRKKPSALQPSKAPGSRPTPQQSLIFGRPTHSRLASLAHPKSCLNDARIDAPFVPSFVQTGRHVFSLLPFLLPYTPNKRETPPFLPLCQRPPPPPPPPRIQQRPSCSSGSSHQLSLRKRPRAFISSPRTSSPPPKSGCFPGRSIPQTWRRSLQRPSSRLFSLPRHRSTSFGSDVSGRPCRSRRDCHQRWQGEEAHEEL
jgi:hypothetical protein